jgi:hypothetical protein
LGKERYGVTTGYDYFACPAKSGSHQCAATFVVAGRRRGARYYDSPSVFVLQIQTRSRLKTDWQGRWLQVDPLAKKYPGWSPYNYVEDSPIYLVDINGMDWYIENETGALRWYNGQYKNSEIPKGYSWLGKDNYFDDKSMYDQLKKLGINTVNLSSEQSLKFAESFGFELAPLESYSEITTFYSSNGNEYSSYTNKTESGSMVWSKLTYVDKNSARDETASLTLKKRPDFGRLYLMEYKRYKYEKPSILTPILKVCEWLMNTEQHSYSQDHIKVYTWKTYPQNGNLEQWRK